jgi:hypothetical protein
MLCGSELFVAPHVTRVEDAPDVFLPGTNLHNCEPGRILREQGSEAYELWRDAQPTGSYMSLDEMEAELDKAEPIP